MQYLKTFESFPGDNYTLSVKSEGEKILPDGITFVANELEDNQNFFYSTEWEKYLPEKMSVFYKGDIHNFKKGNVMLVGDLVEITYDNEPENPWGSPDTLEFDLYFAKDTSTGKIRTTVDITYGDLVVCEFSIENPNKITVIQHTTYHSKFDPSNTVFALEDESLDQFIEFLNRLPGVKLSRHHLRFLDKLDNYKD